MKLIDLVSAERVLPPLTVDEARSVAKSLQDQLSLVVYPTSVVVAKKAAFLLAHDGEEKRLVAISTDAGRLAAYQGTVSEMNSDGTALTACIAPLIPTNAEALRSELPFLRAKLLGLKKSVGCGDRLGLATPGHIRAVRDSEMGIIAAQQSVRENYRTGRTPQQVMDEAMWGGFQEGWRDGFGADADHLKTPEDTQPWIAAGYTFYTIDPGEHVDDGAEEADAALLRQKVEALPWGVLGSSPVDLIQRFTQPIDLGSEQLKIDEVQLLRAAAKYGKAVAHTVKMYRHLLQEMGEGEFELEVSVDETATVTQIEEHVYIANELQRLGVKWVSLAPRYAGEFEKGVDYIGDLAEFRKEFARHVAVAKTYGPYKLSLHSGSDKFSIYPLVAELAGDLVHLKTAGTSYLEALRTVAQVNPDLFKEIMYFAMERYEIDRATYFVSGKLDNVPALAALDADQLVALLDQFDTRQVLHVTFGSVLNHAPFKTGIDAVLAGNEETHYGMVTKHFARHLRPFG